MNFYEVKTKNVNVNVGVRFHVELKKRKNNKNYILTMKFEFIIYILLIKYLKSEKTTENSDVAEELCILFCNNKIKHSVYGFFLN